MRNYYKRLAAWWRRERYYWNPTLADVVRPLRRVK